MHQLLLTILLISQLQGQPSLNTKVIARKLSVGTPFELVIDVNYPNNANPLGPIADSTGSFLVIDHKVKTKSHKGFNTNTYRLKLAGFKTGETSLPRFKFLISDKDRVDTLYSDTLKVTISSVMPAKMSDINDIKPEEKFPNYWLWLIPAAILLLALLGYFGYRIYLKIKKIQELAQAPLPPWIEAMNSLDSLPFKEWLDKGHVQRYYYALSEIIKRYIERRFDFNALEQTTTEIIHDLKTNKTPHREEFGSFLHKADRVKYAKLIPTYQEIEEALQQAKELVQKTTPAEKPEVIDGAKKERN
ncbi:MAG: hypothetical protein KKG02_11440 [Candidatus Edwardsbacteria bacterium]|nr:hypothetical protein [Candidatus Edwardsbacteria bacterium]MBU2595136.1 hypothetical protein [Candidatus Edwardsbacteria bacterium]